MHGGSEDFDLVDADPSKGAFFMPTLLHCENPLQSRSVHSVEAFGPVSTVLPYDSIDEAIELARQQNAKSLELRAATSLACLWQQQGKKVEARALLFEIYDWFTEGFDTADLQDAKALLEEL